MVKLFANFDTQAPSRNYAEAVQQFGFDKVIFLRRHKLYFILYTLIPWIVALILAILFILSMVMVSNSTWIWAVAAHRSTQIIIILLLIYLCLLSRSRYFNYVLDYTIVTPEYISSYNQMGIFSRDIRTVEPSKIKTIDFLSKWVINSLFNFGKIVILLEWDDMGQWEIVMDFIHDPEWVKEWILALTQGISVGW